MSPEIRISAMSSSGKRIPLISTSTSSIGGPSSLSVFCVLLMPPITKPAVAGQTYDDSVPLPRPAPQSYEPSEPYCGPGPAAEDGSASYLSFAGALNEAGSRSTTDFGALTSDSAVFLSPGAIPTVDDLEPAGAPGRVVRVIHHKQGVPAPVQPHPTGRLRDDEPPLRVRGLGLELVGDAARGAGEGNLELGRFAVVRVMHFWLPVEQRLFAGLVIGSAGVSTATDTLPRAKTPRTMSPRITLTSTTTRHEISPPTGALTAGC
jgi:hypothetical protein